MTSVHIKEDVFGEISTPSNGAVPVRRFTFTSPMGGQLQIINYGATITSLKIPDRNGKLDDVVLGFDTIQGYLSDKNRYFGATIGRVCNRTAKGKFTLEGVQYQLGINNGPNHLHGGITGFDKKLWDACVQNGKLIMSYLSPDGEEAYPGHLLVNITFEFTPDNEVLIHYRAMASKQTPISLTNHSYFNLSGDHAADKNLEGHYIQLNANNYTPVDDTLIPTGEIKGVGGTLYDLRKPTQSIPQLLAQFPKGPNVGYDNNFCLNKHGEEPYGLVAVVQDSGSGRVLVIYSDQPGVQFYTSNFLPEKEDATVGKGGAKYAKHGAFCLETQNYPDAINRQGTFPNALLSPGEIYQHKISMRFFTTVESK